MKASRKVDGGKFLELVVEDGQLTIGGDFFVHPEYAIEDLEAVVHGELEASGMTPSVDTLEATIQEHVDANDVDLVGITARAIAELAVEAAE